MFRLNSEIAEMNPRSDVELIPYNKTISTNQMLPPRPIMSAHEYARAAIKLRLTPHSNPESATHRPHIPLAIERAPYTGGYKYFPPFS